MCFYEFDETGQVLETSWFTSIKCVFLYFFLFCVKLLKVEPDFLCLIALISLRNIFDRSILWDLLSFIEEIVRNRLCVKVTELQQKAESVHHCRRLTATSIGAYNSTRMNYLTILTNPWRSHVKYHKNPCVISLKT